MLDVVVIGGGSAGLAAAWRLVQAGLDTVVLEALDRPGGNVHTFEADGFRLEHGPHTLLASADDAFALASEVGADPHLTTTLPTSGDRFIVRDGRLHRAPTGPWSFLTSGLLSPWGKLQLATEPLRTGRGEPTDSAMDFFTRRFGAEAAKILAGAFISGVYAGDPEQLSAPAAFRLFWGFEQEHGGMIRGAIAHRRAGPPRTREGLWSFAEGLGQLPRRAADALGDRVRLGTPAETLVRHDDGTWEIRTFTDSLRARHVVLATPPPQAAALLAPVDPELGHLMAGIPMGPVAVVHLGFRARQAAIPDGFGFLVPRGEGIRSLGVLFPSRLFTGRAPESGDLLAGFVGGALDPGALDLDDDALRGIVLGDLERLVGLATAPDLVRVRRYPQAIPQLIHGHLERVAALEDRSPGGLVFAGNYLRGVGLKDAVTSGFRAARRVLGA